MRTIVGQVHEQGVMHGDLEQGHFVNLGDTMKLVDLDCATINAMPSSTREEFCSFSHMFLS